ncbi:MAG: hypothetical protein K2N15_03165 [Lachnospiraceae bacterium]|nr:hypothetical protein [Lachnospiraceae bacterium]
MFDEFDKYIFEFAVEDFAVDYWYDEGGILQKICFVNLRKMIGKCYWK